MRSRFILPVLLFGCFICTAQYPHAQKKVILKNIMDGKSLDVIETTANNYVLIGHTVDSVPNAWDSRLTLTGLDVNGNLQWKKSYGDNKFRYTPIAGCNNLVIKHQGFLYCATSATDSTGRTWGILMK